MDTQLGSDILNNPEEYLAILSTGQLLEEFGTQFDEGIVSNVPVYLEKKTEQNRSKEDFRFFATPSILATVRSSDIDVWDLEVIDKEAMEQIQKAVAQIKVSVDGENDNMDFDRDIYVKGSVVNVTYEPYIPESSEHILRTLMQRKELLQKKG